MSIVIRVIGGVLATLGLLKLAWLPAFASSMALIRVLPADAQWWLTIGIPTAELAVGLLLFARPKAPLAVGSGVLLAFMLIVGAALADPPTSGRGCGCLGVASQWLDVPPQVFTAFAWMMLITLCVAWVGGATGRPGPTRVRAAERAAFTLVEVVLVIAILTVLAFVLAPTLSLVRESARRVRANSDLRSHAAIFAAYSDDHKDQFPYITDPRGDVSIIRCRSAGLAVRARYFDAFLHWSVALADGYYAGAFRSAALKSPWRPYSGQGIASDYSYPCVFIADATYWSAFSRRRGRVQLVSTRASQVLFPSVKTLLFAAGAGGVSAESDASGLIPTGFVDGSSADIAEHLRTEQYRPADGPDIRLSLHTVALTPYLHTIDGVRGRDVLRR